MGLGKDAKNLILGNDGSDKDPDDFKTELQNAIKAGLINKADGTLLITSRTNCDKLGNLISRTEEKEVIKAGKENGKEFDSLEEEVEYNKEIKDSQNANKAKMESEKNLEKIKEIDRK